MVTIPATTPVQFGPPPTGTFVINKFDDPSGNPINVIDIDLGATLEGTVTLPGYITGTGNVSLAADEIGGSFDGIVKTVPIVLPGGSPPYLPVTYPWKLTFIVPDLPDVSRAYHFALTFAVTSPGGWHTDIAAIVSLGDYMVV